MSASPTFADALPLLGVVVLALAFVAAMLFGPAWGAWRRQRLRARPFPAAWRTVLRREFALYRHLPPDVQRQLQRQMQVFLAEKPFIGCQGLEVTEPMRVLVAAQACLLALNHRHPFPRLRHILLYPSAFVVDRVRPDGSGVLHDRREALAGESWQQGQVILSWPDVQEGAAVADDGRNVVIHEFAHQLDQERGPASGAPFLGQRERYRRWAAVFSQEFQRLRVQLAHGEPTLFGAYAATEPAEFFAVVSEVFFERPVEFVAGHPALYQELAAYYRVDPLSWG
jgi:MtfA peptidase